MASQYHISSLVVQFYPQYHAELQAQINALDGVEIQAQSAGSKWVITLEGDSQQHVDDCFHCIQQMKGVLSVMLIYQQVASLAEGEF